MSKRGWELTEADAKLNRHLRVEREANEATRREADGDRIERAA